MEFIRANIWEIGKSGSLRFLGGLLGLFHVLQFYMWSKADDLPLKYAREAVPLCRSLFESCEWVRLPFAATEAVYYAYVCLAVFAVVIFMLTSLASIGFWALALTWLMGSILYFQDLRLSSNEGFLILFLTISFLLIPAKNRYFRWIIVSYFAASGLAKMSPDWLTGSWVIEHIPIPVKLAEWLAAMSLLIEMIAAVAMLFRDGRFFLTGWLSLLAYQGLLIYIGEIFAPALGLCLLGFVLWDELELRKAEREYLYQSFIRPEPSFIIGGTLLVLFWVAQLLPFVGVNSRSSLRAGFDLLALQPLAAHEECHQVTYAVYKNRIEEISMDVQASQNPMMKCNVYLRFLDLKAMCRTLKEKSPDFVTFNSVLEVRSLRNQAVTRAFEIGDFCQEELNFKKLDGFKWNSRQDK